jgi:hypothetical protein
MPVCYSEIDAEILRFDWLDFSGVAWDWGLVFDDTKNGVSALGKRFKNSRSEYDVKLGKQPVYVTACPGKKPGQVSIISVP